MTNFFEAIINSFRAGWANNNHHQQYQEYYDYSIWGNSESSSHSAYMDWIFSSNENAHYANHNYNNNYPYDYAADSFWSNSYRRYDFNINTDYQNPTSNEDDYTYNPVIIGDAPLEDIKRSNNSKNNPKTPDKSSDTTPPLNAGDAGNAGNAGDAGNAGNAGESGKRKSKITEINLPGYGIIKLPPTATIVTNTNGKPELIKFITSQNEQIEISCIYNENGSLGKITYKNLTKETSDISTLSYNKDGQLETRETKTFAKDKIVKTTKEYPLGQDVQYFDLPKIKLVAGAIEEYNQNGQLVTVRNGKETIKISYKNGQNDYEYVTFLNEAGKTKKTYRHGPNQQTIAIYDENGKKISYENKTTNEKSTFEYTETEEIQTFYKNGTIIGKKTKNLATGTSIQILYDNGKPFYESHLDAQGKEVKGFNIDASGNKTLDVKKAPAFHQVYLNTPDDQRFIAIFNTQIGDYVLSEAFKNPNPSNTELIILAAVGKQFDVTNPDKYAEIKKNIEEKSSAEQKTTLLAFLDKLVELRKRDLAGTLEIADNGGDAANPPSPKNKEIKYIDIKIPGLGEERVPETAKITKNDKNQITSLEFDEDSEHIVATLEYNEKGLVSKMVGTIGANEKVEKLFEYNDAGELKLETRQNYENGVFKGTTKIYPLGHNAKYFDLPEMELGRNAREEYDTKGRLIKVKHGYIEMTIEYQDQEINGQNYKKIIIEDSAKGYTTTCRTDKHGNTMMTLDNKNNKYIFYRNNTIDEETHTEYKGEMEIKTAYQKGILFSTNFYNTETGMQKTIYWDSDPKSRYAVELDALGNELRRYPVDENGDEIKEKNS